MPEGFRLTGDGAPGSSCPTEWFILKWWMLIERAGVLTGPYEISASVGADVLIGPSPYGAVGGDRAGGQRPPLRVVHRSILKICPAEPDTFTLNS